jgi:diguanylate cyclase (GGDEF)-like protein
MQIVRLAVSVIVLIYGLFSQAPLAISLRDLAASTGAYLLLSFAAYGLWRLLGRRGLLLFGGMLIVDGPYLAWVVHVSGGVMSPLRALIVLHLVAAALLASYRTGLKLAFWHSLLLLTVYYAEDAGLVKASAGYQALGTASFRQTLVFIAIFWVVTIATASLSAVNERELRRRRFDLEALAKMARELEDARSAAQVAELVLDNVVDTFDFRRAVVLGHRNGELTLVGARDATQIALGQPVSMSSSVVEEAMASRNAVLVAQLDKRTDRSLEALLPGASNLLVVPLSAEGICIGLLIVEHGLRSGTRIERRVVSTLERFASHAALALRNAWLLEQVQKLAATDSLTGIANRRVFADRLDEEFARAERTGRSFSVLLMDIDHFKLINDSLGHEVGDQALREVAHCLASQARPFDLAARYGGEEFAIILPACDESDALRIAERLRISVSEISAPTPLTISAGVATFPADGLDAASLMRAADDALYQSKRAGRNRVTGPPERTGLQLVATDSDRAAGSPAA